MSKETDSVANLLGIMRQLRDPQSGCPWDLKQTFSSIVPHTIEEAYEVADAIYSEDMESIKDECGDLLFQIVFYAQLAEEKKAFTFADVAQAISDKLIRRHPHVFAEGERLSEKGLNEQWEAIKALEKPTQNTTQSVFDNVPSGLPALKLAYKTQKACAKVGFDWREPAPVLDKVKEEVAEVEQEMLRQPVDKQALESEIGDAFFALVNLSRHYSIDADAALRKANHKFQTRFRHIETQVKQENKDIQDLSLEQLEHKWQAAKQNEH